MPHVRFAFKTAPQNTTWADMLAVWKEADDVEIFESGWLFDHFDPIVGDSAGPCLGEVGIVAVTLEVHHRGGHLPSQPEEQQ